MRTMPDENRMPLDEGQVADLCAQARAGDAAALEALLALHHARLRGFALRKIGPDWGGRIEAEDVLQDAYIEAFRHIAQFEPRDGESFYRWVTQIIENRFLDQMRHWRRQKRDVGRIAAAPAVAAGASVYDSLLQQCSAAGERPSVLARRDEALGALLGCLAQLSDEYRTVVQRVHLNEERYEAVAADLGRSPEAVRRMTTRAVEKLRECLGRASRYLSRA